MDTSPQPPTVSIIIVNYNTSHLINNCLESVFNLTEGIKFEIIVVDNATEILKDTIKEASNPIVKLLQLPDNIGFGRANNAGAKLASGRYLLFLNPDTLLVNNALKILSDFLDGNPRCGACGGNLYDEAMIPSISFRRIAPGIFFELNELLHLVPERLRYGKNVRFNNLGHPIKVPYVSGADLMIRSNLFKKLDGFSPEFFMYYEETDLCRKVYREGMSVYSVPDAKIIHLEGRSFDYSMKANKVRITEKGRLVYYRRNHTHLHNFFAHFMYKTFLWSRVMMARDKVKKDYYGLRLKCFKQMQKIIEK